MSETAVLRQILVALSAEPGVRAFRNNCGAHRTESGGWVTYGLCKGSADIVGIKSPGGRFIAIEVKPAKGDRTTPGRRISQANFLAMVREHGGLAGIARSVDDALAIVRETTS